MRHWIAAGILGTVAGAEVQAASPWKQPRFKQEFVASYGVDSRIEPDVDEEQRAFLEQLEPLLEKEKKKAIAMLEAANTPEPAKPRYDFLLGNLCLETGDMQAAKKHFAAAIKKFPNYRQAYKNLGLLLAQQQDFATAARALGKVLELGEADGSAYGLLGRCHLAADDGISAETAFRQAIMLQPDVLDWRKGLLSALVKQRRTADAAAILDEMIERDPGNKELHLQQAQVYLAANDFMQAAQILEVAARAGWTGAAELHQLGDIYVRQEQPDLAMEAFRRAFHADPRQEPGRCIRAVEVLAGSHALDQAAKLSADLRETLGEALSAADRARLAKADSRIALGQHADDKAAVMLEEVVKEDPLDGEAWMLLGRYHSEKSSPEKAIFAYERAASLDKFKADAKVKMAQLYVGQSKFVEAVALLKEAQETNRRDAVGRYLEQVEKMARLKSSK